jgi:hypothetical protein
MIVGCSLAALCGSSRALNVSCCSCTAVGSYPLAVTSLFAGKHCAVEGFVMKSGLARSQLGACHRA